MKKGLIRRIRSRLRPLRLWSVWQAIRLCDGLVLMACPKPARTQGVAVVKLDAIGDLVVWLDAAKELKALYPGCKITLFANAMCAELAGKLPYWDEVCPVDVVRLRIEGCTAYRARLLRSVRRRGFDVAIQPTFSRELEVGDTLLRATGARERIGSVGDLYNMTAAQKRVADRWYTRRLPANPQPMTELERNAEFIRHLGKPGFAATLPVLPRLLELPERLRLAAPYLILFPGAGWTGRQWPVARFADIANQLSRSLGLQAVVCGSKGELALCQSVVSAAEVNVLNLAGQTSLPEFVELVRGARLLVGNETSAVHIAGAVGTASVGILGGGHYGRFMPYPEAPGCHAPQSAVHPMPCFKCDWQCTQPHQAGGPMPCIDGVTVENVMRVSRRALAVGEFA